MCSGQTCGESAVANEGDTATSPVLTNKTERPANSAASAYIDWLKMRGEMVQANVDDTVMKKPSQLNNEVESGTPVNDYIT